MRTWIGIGLLLLASASMAEEPTAYRTVAGVDLRVFSCAPESEFQLVTSPKDLARFGESAGRCDAAHAASFKADFLRSLEAARFDWNNEVLLVVVSHYGTGMAKGHLELKPSSPGVLVAEIVWKVPPPPVTPDTATFSAVVGIRRSLVSKVIERYGATTRRVWNIPPAIK